MWAVLGGLKAAITCRFVAERQGPPDPRCRSGRRWARGRPPRGSPACRGGREYRAPCRPG
eukprot:9290687-Alexandrium_andersonii.AAC.1